MSRKLVKLAIAAMALSIAAPAVPPVHAAQPLFCSDNGARFNEWKNAVKTKYKGKFKASTLAKLDRVAYDAKVIKLDRGNKKGFKGTFDSFYKRRSAGVAPLARKKWKQYKQYFDRAERDFGVPAEVILAIWGLESAFGRYSGSFPILQSTATLAYDCRRSASLFYPQFVSALTVIDRGLVDLSTRKGAWAGEIGQTQFLASSFLLGAVDYDGGGVDVFRSAPDVIGSTSKWFAANGWRRGGSYAEGSGNYNVIKKWNKATNYQKTIAKLARVIRG